MSVQSRRAQTEQRRVEDIGYSHVSQGLEHRWSSLGVEVKHDLIATDFVEPDPLDLVLGEPLPGPRGRGWRPRLLP